MRWFRRRSVPHDEGLRQALFDDVRQRFGAHLPQPFTEQADAVARLLTGDDGVAVAAAVVHDFARGTGLHPYIQVAGALTVLGGHARRSVRIIDPVRVLTDILEVLDMLIVGWHSGQIRVDIDATTLAERLISTAQDIRAALDNPPPLPSAIRELMRSNYTAQVLDPATNRIAGPINPGRLMRESFLV